MKDPKLPTGTRLGSDAARFASRALRDSELLGRSGRPRWGEGIGGKTGGRDAWEI